MNFPPSQVILPGQLLLVTDELSSSADFLLHQIVCERLRSAKSGSGSGVTILTMSGPEAGSRWKAIATKSGLTSGVVSSFLHFVDVCSDSDTPGGIAAVGSASLKGCYDRLSSRLSQASQAAELIILDDISTLEWIGYDIADVQKFTRALVALCRKAQAPLIIRHHVLCTSTREPIFTEDESSDDLFNLLAQLASFHVEIKSLASGRSGSVSGEIALYHGPSLHNVEKSAVKAISRTSALQYRLTDYSAVYFHRGTASGVL
ncbi:hypothetical protein BDV98DRAFT_527445 [Pterulicium gracile]|uniref:Elongator complex protein 6 n=1 Tax=Pterulicium gracile TaxID=1884261 RepID=A0A5C3QLU8_9AGAR|nr:hypothetical protein BDV98DRAFT_527445 [Pterula gracilis]